MHIIEYLLYQAPHKHYLYCSKMCSKRVKQPQEIWADIGDEGFKTRSGNAGINTGCVT